MPSQYLFEKEPSRNDKSKTSVAFKGGPYLSVLVLEGLETLGMMVPGAGVAAYLAHANVSHIVYKHVVTPRHNTLGMMSLASLNHSQIILGSAVSAEFHLKISKCAPLLSSLW
jgi:hypothetical protein